jgi:hypothetical protein
MKVEDLLPKELTEILNSSAFEEDEAYIEIDSVNFIGRDLRLKFSFHYDNLAPTNYWELKVSEVRQERIDREWTRCIRLYKQHPLLLPYTDTYAEPYFKGTTLHYRELCADLYMSLFTLTDAITEFRNYVFTPEVIKEDCLRGSGIFAGGSKTILMLYQQCLTKYGIHSYFENEREFFGEGEGLKLFQLGSSYIIGRNFHFEQLK